MGQPSSGELLPSAANAQRERALSVFFRKQKLRKARRRLQSLGATPRSKKDVAPRAFSHEELQDYKEEVFSLPSYEVASRTPWVPTEETTLNRSMSVPSKAPKAQRGQRYTSVGSDPTGPPIVGDRRQRSGTIINPRSFVPEDRKVDRTRSLSVKGTDQRQRETKRRGRSEAAADPLREDWGKGKKRKTLIPEKIEAAGGPGPKKGPEDPDPDPGMKQALAMFSNENEALQVAASNVPTRAHSDD